MRGPHAQLLSVAPALLLLVGPSSELAAQVSWDDPALRIEAAESRVEEYLGREALVLQNGIAWLHDVRLLNGVVEFDLAVEPTLGFHGLAFRATDDANYEHVYLRPHLSGRPDAVQYTPVFHGVSGWQIHAGPRYALPAEVPAGRWIHVRLVVRGGVAELSVDGERLLFPGLVRAPAPGRIGLTASGALARFANLVVRPDVVPTIEGEGAEPAETPTGTVRRWRVSTPFAEARLDPLRELDPGAWEDLEWDVLDWEGAGDRGIANLATLRPHGPERNTVFAAVTLEARAAGLARVRFGFSDRILVYLNGRPLYRADDGWRTRDYRFLGTIGLHDELVLPLRRGSNELWLAVSEGFGGWGVTLQLPEDRGVTVVEPR